MTRMDKLKIKDTVCEGEELTYTLKYIDRGVLIQFTVNENVYEVEIVQKSIGHTSMTDYYKYGDALTHDEFNELERLVNFIDNMVLKVNYDD